MEVSYKKDLRHNYMVITEDDTNLAESYSIKMLEHQTIEGVLTVEQRSMDNNILYYYDITAKQSMTTILEKTALSYNKLILICSFIIETIERAYEYLLLEEDFILLPEYIYIDVVTNKPSLCYLPRYDKPLKQQMNSLFEYLMNKVDYNDKDAVLLIYQLYAVSREEGYTFEHLNKVLQEKPQTDIERIGKNREENKENYNNKENHINKEYCSDKENYNSNENYKNKDAIIIENGKKEKEHNFRFQKEKPESKDNISTCIPVMFEKLEGEEEIPCYPLKTYLFTGFSIAGGVLIVVFSLYSKILYNSYGNRMDYSKLFALFLVIFCVEGYLLKRLWDKKNRITKIITKSEYVDPRQELNPFKVPEESKVKNIRGAAKKLGIPQEQQNYSEKNYSNRKQESLKPAYQRGYNNNQPFDNFGVDNEIKNKEIKKNASVEQKHTCDEDDKISETFAFKKKASVENASFDSTRINKRVEPEEDDNPTCLLNAAGLDVSDISSFNCDVILTLKPIDEINYQPIAIKEFPFFIGKLRKNVDYCLENEAVSRYHAKITKEENLYYITDLNSTNGTFVNNETVLTYQKKEIKIGDEIALANIRYNLIR